MFKLLAAGHSWGVFAKGAIRPQFEVFWPHSWGWFSQTRVRPVNPLDLRQWLPVENMAILWKPQWKPRVWQPCELVTFRGNHRLGSRQPRVRGCEPQCEPAAGTRPNAYQPCVLSCVLTVRNLRIYCAVQRPLLRLERLWATRAPLTVQASSHELWLGDAFVRVTISIVRDA